MGCNRSRNLRFSWLRGLCRLRLLLSLALCCADFKRQRVDRRLQRLRLRIDF